MVKTQPSPRLFFFPASFLALAVVFFLGGCSVPEGGNLVRPPHLPLFYDDGTNNSLQSALQQQQHYVDSLKENDGITIGTKRYSSAQLSESIKTFRNIIELDPSPLELDRILRENFTFFQAGGRLNSVDNEMLVTGYFEPILQGSLQRVAPFVYPIYARPPDLVERRSTAGRGKIGRIDTGGNFQPYWTRSEIESSGFAEGHELVFLKDPFDAFLLHIQGSGKIKLPDGTLRSIQYHANNGHPYASIGKLLVDERKMALSEVDVPTLRRHLQSASPQEQQRIYHHNPRYIFFKWGNGSPVTGSLGLPLTPGRSIAIDKDILPMGMIAYLVCQKPVVDDKGNILRWVPLQRFVLPQDSGAAIKGPGRVDLFFGSGNYAETAAGAMKEKGYLYFLIQNDFEEGPEKSD